MPIPLTGRVAWRIGLKEKIPAPQVRKTGLVFEKKAVGKGPPF